MNNAEDYVKQVMDATMPMVRAGEFGRVCVQLEGAIELAMERGLSEDAASLSNILASFQTIADDDQAALASLKRAERLAPADIHHQLSTAEHLFFRVDRRDEAAEKVRAVADSREADAITRHRAAALLGRFAAHEGRFVEAADRLSQAYAIASAELESRWWDLGLPAALAACSGADEVMREYLNALGARADAEGEEKIASEARQLLDRHP